MNALAGLAVGMQPQLSFTILCFATKYSSRWPL